MKYVARLKEKYRKDIVPSLMEQFNYSSVMQVPRVEKICINQGVGDATGDKKLVDTAMSEISVIAGQKAVSVNAKRSVSNFKLREGMPIGVRVTLRGERMYEFLDRFIHVTLPRVRDFRGLNDKSFDGRGNYSMGITEQIVFPEIDIDKVNKITGMDITIVTTAQTDAEAYALLKEMGMPFKK
ncbi:MAG: 50S ribosomal protein L5 [Lewinellaceae bacterium]|nr:50S ribosomal protein L5 [Saprospiraceae bacterium]MCB9314875.1 50S ribosomal protein L5 [Lewinellaceae bacterium]MCB9333032.1 50S ribosomal protein L5 [Lewinellaceae bacterium]